LVTQQPEVELPSNPTMILFGLAALPKAAFTPLRIFENRGEEKGDSYLSNALKWATAAAVEFATPADPDNSALSAMKISGSNWW
jgi:hypothetical protein